MKLFLPFVLLIVTINSFAQFPGTKSKVPFDAIDGQTYSVGDKLKVLRPYSGKEFSSVLLYDYKTGTEKAGDFLSVLSGEGYKVKESKIYSTGDDVRNAEFKIKYFKHTRLDKEIKVFAIAAYDVHYNIAISLNDGLKVGEVASKDSLYTPEIELEKSSTINSFSPDYKIEFIEAVGNTNNQTVTVTFKMKHNLVHQNISINGGKAMLYDNDGNGYSGSNIEALGKTALYSINKVPTGVPVKYKITFNQILPKNTLFTYLTMPVQYKPYDGYSMYSQGTLEMYNINVIWK